MTVDDNQAVRGGGVLVMLDPRDYEAVLVVVRAALQRDTTEVGDVLANLGRQRGWLPDGRSPP